MKTGAPDDGENVGNPVALPIDGASVAVAEGASDGASGVKNSYGIRLKVVLGMVKSTFTNTYVLMVKWWVLRLG